MTADVLQCFWCAHFGQAEQQLQVGAGVNADVVGAKILVWFCGFAIVLEVMEQLQVWAAVNADVCNVLIVIASVLAELKLPKLMTTLSTDLTGLISL